jgi:hypothetical protein
LYVKICKYSRTFGGLTSDVLNRLAAANRGTKKVLEQVDHSKVEYLPFRKDFYIEVPEIAKMTEEEVNIHREALEDMKIRVSLIEPTVVFPKLVDL